MTGAIQNVREELGHHRASRRCCRLAELSALAHLDGSYTIRGRKGHLLITESGSPITARKIHKLSHELFTVETSVVTMSRSTPRRGNVYRLEIPEQPGFFQVLNELGLLDSSLYPERVLPGRLTKKECCVASSLSGAFLGGGYVSGPRGAADLEITFSSLETCHCFKQLMNRKGLEPEARERRGHWVLYMKRRQSISSFLAIIGAHSAHLQWESQSIINATKNSVNRQVNCDTSNARRLAEASLRQRELVEELEKLGILATADPLLREMAEARIRYPQASLAELGTLLHPPVSKGTAQGRMRKLEAMLPRSLSGG